MSRRLRPMLAMLSLVASGGCSRGSAKVPPPGEIEAEAAIASSAALAATEASTAPESPRLSPAVFSAPIAAARVHHEVVVAGLVAAEGVIRVMGLAERGPSWSVDVLPGVAWVQDAELKLQPADDGVALVWRGSLGGKAGATLVVLGPRGEPRGGPIPIGAGACATADGLAWIDPRGSSSVHVRARRWTEDTPRDVATLSPDREPTLLCGDHDAFVLGDGDDDLTATAFSPEEAARPPVVAIRNRDFGDDDEREHEAFTVGDELGVVRVGGSGTIAMREVAHGHPSPWRRLKHALSEDDDIVAVDGDAAATLIVYTREATDPCAGSESGAQSVRALRIDRKTGEETLVPLAPADCDSSAGPFWIATAPGASLVAWNHRKAKPASSAAPIDGLDYRDLRTDRPGEGRVPIEGDMLVDAGCDDAGCFAAALVRRPDDDGGRPEAILSLRYPR